MKPTDALKRLKLGNQRFQSGLRSIESLASVTKIGELAATGQKPFASILTCSDSRVPAETVFDQGIGDLFVIRVAGNVLNEDGLASLEFASLFLGTSLCVVMGHTLCGAIESALMLKEKKGKAPTPSLVQLMSRLQVPINKVVSDRKPHLDLHHDVGEANVKYVCQSILTQSKTLKNLANQKKFSVVGALYNIASGKIEWIP